MLHMLTFISSENMFKKIQRNFFRALYRNDYDTFK